MLLITHTDTTQLHTNCLALPVEKIVMWVLPRDGNWLLLGTNSYFISSDITTVPGGQWYCQGNDWILWPYNPFHDESVWIGIWREIIGTLAHISSWNIVSLGISSYISTSPRYMYSYFLFQDFSYDFHMNIWFDGTYDDIHNISKTVFCSGIWKYLKLSFWDCCHVSTEIHFKFDNR